MKYRLESTTIEAIDSYVRISIGDYKTEVTKKECPLPIEVATMLGQIQGYYPNRAQLQVCARAADDARRNKVESELVL